MSDKVINDMARKINELIAENKELKGQLAEMDRHGEWQDVYTGQLYRCSECSKIRNYKYKYCPDCGAKMGDEKNG